MITIEGRLSRNEICRIEKHRVCSECWGPLYYIPPQDMSYTSVSFSCRTPGCSCSGSVSLRTVEIRESTSERDLHKAREALAEALGLPGRVTPKSEAALLKEMGF